MSSIDTTATPTSRWAAPRKHGTVTGLGLILLGAWGAIVPFIGPYFDYAYTPNRTWTWTAGRAYLEVLPGTVTFFVGIALVMTAHRARGALVAWLGVLAGAWFVVGPLLTPIWSKTDLGTPIGGTRTVAVEQIGIFYGLGAAIVLLAAAAVGRFSVATLREETAPAAAPVPLTETPVAAMPAPREAAYGWQDQVPTTTQAMPPMPPEPVGMSSAPAEDQPATSEQPTRRRQWIPGRHRHSAVH